MFDFLIHLVSGSLILIGSIFVVGGGVGLIRMPDLYTRLHTASVTDTGGTIFILLGLMVLAIFEYGSALVTAKLLLVLFFTLFTAPTSSHALAKTALLTGQVPVDEHGRPILDSPETAQLLARSVRPDR